ncbi:hypothetical protein FNF27_02062 [Cafeteria roenbergensis]|uniref:Sphingomyelin phosphodiesterase n=2 Tax=Cafeteria roenbergensis TaxID=33653 RepID=A0A5A8EEU6_CAFRO|nr:hypothetical protein FNF27_02062 [Cafeteria roenbergensis]
MRSIAGALLIGAVLAAPSVALSRSASAGALARFVALTSSTAPGLGNETMTCEECEAVIAEVANAIQSKDAYDVVQAVAELVCIEGKGGFGYSCGNPWACNDLCRGITSLFTPEILFIAAHAALDPERDCTALGLCNASTLAEAPILRAAPSFPSAPREAGTTIKVMQITDLHWDPNYTMGARTDCGEPDCCRGVQGMATGSETACGYWGDHAGDTPTVMVDSMLAFASGLNPDFVMLTGDYPPHMVWNVTAEAVVDVSLAFSAKVKAAFGQTPVFGIAGNHEGAPINQFRLELDGEGSKRLFAPLADQWGGFGWLDASAQSQLARGGYYTTLVPGVKTTDGRPLRLVALHPAYHMKSNFYTLLDQSLDVANETSWMQATIEQAAADGEVVWIMTHHPTNDGDYSDEFMEGFFAPLVAKYRSTVRHVFSGHTHKSMTQLLWANATNSSVLEPAVINYIAAAPTPYGGVNPTFRMYEVELDTMEVVDYVDYTVDLRAQGLLQQMTEQPAAEWRASKPARQAFNMTALQPRDWHVMAERMRHDDALFRTWEVSYHTNNTEASNFSPKERLVRVCDIIGGTKRLNKACMEGRFNTSLPAGSA